MTDTEILDAIQHHRLWLHPAGSFHTGWNCNDGTNEFFSWNKPTPRQAVEDVVRKMREAKERP